MRILGIDPGLRTTGFGVLDAEGTQLRYVASGVIQTSSADQGDLPARLKLLFDGITQLRAHYLPDVAAVEIVFVNVNPQATLLLGQARGACLTALVASDLPVAEYTALQMKQAVAGHGKAAKPQVQAMVQRLLGLPAAPRADANRASTGCAGTDRHRAPRALASADRASGPGRGSQTRRATSPRATRRGSAPAPSRAARRHRSACRVRVRGQVHGVCPGRAGKLDS